jgi:nucleoside-diphosphate-sugar epimerase
MTESSKTVLVVGATGATGKHVVQFLLDQGHTVKVVARSKERMLSLLKGDDSDKNDRLQITEAGILTLKQSELDDLVKGCDAVVSCLGHNMTMEGMWGKANRRLVKDSVKRLTKAIENNAAAAEESTKKCKFILMGSDGVAHPNDDKRGAVERFIIFLLRYLVPPHADNEEAAAFLLNDCNKSTTVEWSVVRPTDLQDGETCGYELFPKPQGSLFGAGIATRANVAKFMVDLILKDDKWSQYKYQMPVLHDRKDDTKKSK